MKKIILSALFAALAAPVFAEPACSRGEALKPMGSGQILRGSGRSGHRGHDQLGWMLRSLRHAERHQTGVFFDPNTGV
ncbi:hypothetical protein [Pseudogemmobacter sp. W21_MBD1_M6]|uniref:hypothetical protein n=1 Tax=Pseudogemmobacter sp. W21_MBD1_M6 TaxID=3240271 RepID=UPI003F9D1DF9